MQTRSIQIRASQIVLAGLLATAPLGVLAAAPTTITDQSVSDAVEDELAADLAVPEQAIYVDTSEGIVTLTGLVDSLLAKERAARIAETVKGVRAVVNNVAVRPSPLRANEAIRRDVEQALLVDPATEGLEIGVAVNDDGVVTLSGSVDSWQERELASTVAKGVRGVTAVENGIALDSEAARSDAEIAAEIERRLRWDVLVDDGLIAVAVDDGTVRLTGTVGSAAEKTRAAAKAWVTGVEAVDNSGLEVERWARDPDLRATKYVAKSDSEVREAIEDALLYDPRVALFNVTPEVENGIATLRGMVDNLAAKRAAAEAARYTVGVQGVDNRVRVKPAGVRADGEIAEDVRKALLRDAYVERHEILVAVINGTAYLTGTVDTYFEKARADVVAAQVDGVIEVDNNLIVAEPGVPLAYDPYLHQPSLYNAPAHEYEWYDFVPTRSHLTDARIGEQIKDELWWSPFVDAEQVSVSVEDGVAVLTGAVDSWSERSAAIENAWEGGAGWVVNELRVDGES